MERVKEGEKYWFINGLFTVEARYESNGIMDTELFKVNNYFPASDYTPKMVNEMAEKIRKVLKGAIVIDKLPSEKEIENEALENNWIHKERGDCNYPDNLCIEYFKDGVNWLKSKIVK